MIEAPRYDVLSLSVRVFTVRSAQPRQESLAIVPAPQPKRHYPREVLITDTETTTDPEQRLDVGRWFFYRDSPGSKPLSSCIEDGMYYADDLPQRNPAGFRDVLAYVDSQVAMTAPGFPKQIVLMPVSRWLQTRLFRYGYQHRGRCHIVGFNLLFDVGRLALHWSAAGGYYRGGWSLGFWGHFGVDGGWHDLRYHPRLLAKAIDPRRTLFAWGSLSRGDADGKRTINNLVDLHTCAFTLTDRNLTLEKACAAFGDPYTKRPVRYGVIDREMLVYLGEDVAHTATLYRNCLLELQRHSGIDLRPERLYSAASVGSAYYEAMGLMRPLQKFTTLSAEELGWRR